MSEHLINSLQAIPAGMPWWLVLMVVMIPTVPGTLGAIVAFLSFLQSRQNTKNIQTLNTAVADNTTETAMLAKNIDGAMTEIKTVIGEKNLAEGKLAGMAAERDRPAELITDPQQVTKALNGPDVREQIDRIETIANGTSATSDRIEKHASDVEQDLAEAHKRAGEVKGGEGAAADASAQLTSKEKKLT